MKKSVESLLQQSYHLGCQVESFLCYQHKFKLPTTAIKTYVNIVETVIPSFYHTLVYMKNKKIDIPTKFDKKVKIFYTSNCLNNSKLISNKYNINLKQYFNTEIPVSFCMLDEDSVFLEKMHSDSIEICEYLVTLHSPIYNGRYYDIMKYMVHSSYAQLVLNAAETVGKTLI